MGTPECPGICCVVYCTVFLPALHRKAHLSFCPAPNSRRNSRQAPSRAWPSPGRYMTMLGTRSTSQCTARHGQACQSTTAWAGSYVPVWVVWVVYRSSPPQYSIESFALIIFHGHWHWTGAISRSSPPRHSLSPSPCCPLSTLYLFPSRRPVSHCSLMPRECGKTSIGGSTSRVRDETAQNTPEPTPPFLVILSSQEFPTLSSGCTTVHPIYADTCT